MIRIYYLPPGVSKSDLELRHLALERELDPNAARRSDLTCPASAVLAREEKLKDILRRAEPGTKVILERIAVARCQVVTITRILKERKNDGISVILLEPRLMRLSFLNNAFIEMGELLLAADDSVRGLVAAHANEPIPKDIIERMRKDRASGLCFAEIATKYRYHKKTVRTHTQDVLTTHHVMQIRRQRRSERDKGEKATMDYSFLQSPSPFLDAVRLGIGFAGGVARTREAYLANVRKFVVFVEEKYELKIMRPEQITDAIATAYKEDLVERELSPSTISSRISTLRKLFHILVRRQMAVINPFEFIRVPKTNRSHTRFEAMTEDEVNRLFTVAMNRIGSSPQSKNPIQYWRARRDYLMMKILFSTGVRVSGIVNLKPGDFSLEGARPNVKVKVKSDQFYRVPLPDVLAVECREFLSEFCREMNPERDFVFHAEDMFAAPMTINTVSLVLRKFAKKAGIKRHLTPHCARVTFATICHKNGMPLAEIQLRLNHNNIQTTRGYVQYTETTKQDWLPAFALERGVSAPL